MDFWETVKKRRSIRKFYSKPVEPEKIKKCLEAAFLAPSALNSQPWRFYVATGSKRDELVQIIKKYPIYIADLMEYYPQLKDEAAQKKISEFAENLGDAPVLVIVTMPETSNQTVRKYQLIACGAAIENFYLAATSLGLATVCLTSAAFVEEEIIDYLGIRGEEVVTVLPLGYPLESPEPLPRKDKSVFL